jgi:hypothetical protein
LTIKKFNCNNAALKSFHKTSQKLLEKIPIRKLISHSIHYPEFWAAYQEAYKIGSKLASIDFQNDPKAKKSAGKRLRHIKSAYGGEIEEGVEARNFAIINWKVQKKRSDVVQRVVGERKRRKASVQELDQQDKINTARDSDLITTTEQRIEKKYIKEISFASQITRDVVDRQTTQQSFINKMLKDYVEQLRKDLSPKSEAEPPHNTHYVKLGAKKRGAANSIDKQESASIRVGGVSEKNPSPFVFQHLTITHNLRQALNDIAQDLTEKLASCSPRELTDINKKLDAITKVVDTARKLDMQPIYFFNQISEGGFNSQKELQGAIINDKTMVDNGQIILDKPQDEELINQDDLREDIKLIGASLLEGAIFANQNPENLKVVSKDA